MMTELDAVRAYRDETADHNRTCYTSLNELSGTTHCLVAKADAAIAALEAKLAAAEERVRELEAALESSNAEADLFQSATDNLARKLSDAEDKARHMETEYLIVIGTISEWIDGLKKEYQEAIRSGQELYREGK